MNYTKALEYIHSATRLGSRLGLGRILELLDRMGNPHKRSKFIHIAGTNGKGSTSAMTASVLQASGYNTGLYTSPYLYRFNERIQVAKAGDTKFQQIPDDVLADIASYVKSHIDSMDSSPTEFEIVTAIGFEFFARCECDFVALEVGLGGRLDATNVIETPECAIITAIGYDHMAELGDTLESIAWAKAGIIKSGCDTVLYGQAQSVIDVIAEECDSLNSTLHIADFTQLEQLSSTRDSQVFRYRGKGDYSIPLLGEHQMKNASVVIEAIDVLRAKGYDISDEALKLGLNSTVWPGRFEILSRDPYFVVDGGHNPQCAETVTANINEYFPGQKAVMLIGVLGDKDFPEMVSILDPVAERYVAVSPDNPRALPADKLAEYLSGFGKPVQVCESVESGVAAALELAKDTTGVACAVGSLYMTGSIRACFDKY